MGRPVGSTTGRVPPGGYPDLAADFGAFLAGFLEGEASFGIVRQAHRSNHRCVMSLALRDDDQDLLRKLVARTRIGAIRPRAAYRSSRPQVVWTVVAKSDCVRLVEILDRWKLRGRKRADYLLWRAAVESWVGDGPSVFRKDRDWALMRELRQQLRESRRFDPDRPADFEDLGPNEHWRGYISGLLTADGSLSISQNGNNFTPRVSITLRADDAPLLAEIRRLVGVGRLNPGAARGGASPSMTWAVRDGPGLRAVHDYLNPCPPLGRRGIEFELWSRAVAVHTSTEPASSRRLKLLELRKELRRLRKYVPRSESERAA